MMRRLQRPPPLFGNRLGAGADIDHAALVRMAVRCRNLTEDDVCHDVRLVVRRSRDNAAVRNLAAATGGRSLEAGDLALANQQAAINDEAAGRSGSAAFASHDQQRLTCGHSETLTHDIGSDCLLIPITLSVSFFPLQGCRFFDQCFTGCDA